MAAKVEFIAQNGELVRPGARKSLWILALSVLAGLSVGLATQAGNFLIIDAPSRSDAILVLAGETDRRPQRALELLSQGYGRRVVLDVPRTQNLRVYSNRISAEVHRRSASADPSQHLPDPWTVKHGLSNKDESREAEKCLQREGAKSVLIVTSDVAVEKLLPAKFTKIKSH